MYSADNLLLAGVALLSCLFLLSKTIEISNKKIILHDNTMTYGKKNIPYNSIQSIQRISQDLTSTGDILFNFLGRSNVYILNVDDGNYQILGKFYQDIDLVMQRVAKSANLEIQGR